MTASGDGPTHDWSRLVDHEHLAAIRAEPARFAPGGVTHLLLEVLGYAAEEAQARGGGRCLVELAADGSVLVADDGRGTQVRVEQGTSLRKPVMSTADLRFSDGAAPVLLPDGWPRRGISVVAAMSPWLVLTNRRVEGSWTQRFEHGVPVTDLVAVPDDGSTGTSVHFLPAADLTPLPPAVVVEQVTGTWPHLCVELRDHRA